jgi:phosphate acyltransferase
MKILVDAMGGDNAPGVIIDGSIDAITEKNGFTVSLIGDSEVINNLLSKKHYDKSRIEVIHAPDTITNDDIPTKAIRQKKSSSMVVGLRMLRDGEGKVFLSCGNSGALLAGGLLIVGRIKGVDRPALAPLLPTKENPTLLIDAGANVLCKSINYLQFGIMGSIYMKERFKIEEPTVGLVNVGTEDKKGNEALRSAFSLLSEADINFVGNIEGRDITDGVADVTVCDGFVGNVLLKYIEGVGLFFKDSLKSIFMKNIISKFSSLLIKKDLLSFMNKIDYENFGGAPLIGVKGWVIKSHGSSKSRSIKSAIINSYNLACTSVIEQISLKFKNMEVDELGKEI